MGSVWWVFMFLSAWSVLLVATNKENFKAFWTGGLWSVGLAIVCELLIRSHINYFARGTLIFPLFGTDLLNFLGPRFVEGVLFMQTLRPANQLLQVALWIISVPGAEILTPVTDGSPFSLSNFSLALGVHGLRFLGLLGIHSALNYGAKRERFILQKKRRQRKAAILQASRLFWPVSWPFFSMSALMIVKGLTALSKRSSTD